MAARTVLHVGTMKSGTTHVQSRLYANRERLAAGGVLLPGAAWRQQARAAEELRDEGRVVPGGRWDRLADEVVRNDGTAIISMEFLGPMRVELVKQAAASLPGVEVVMTVRDLNRNLASMWQETLQTGRSWTWEAYVADVRAHGPGRGGLTPDAPRAARGFWSNHNAVRIARNWSGVAPLTIVTVPPPEADRELLWRRVCTAFDLPAPDEGWLPAGRSNESLGVASLEVLRRVNALLDESGLSYADSWALRKHVLAKRVLASRRAEEPGLGLQVRPWLDRRSTWLLDRLRQVPARLVGDWDDLTPREVPGVHPDELDAEQVAEAAVAAVVGLVRHAAPADQERVRSRDAALAAQSASADG